MDWVIFLKEILCVYVCAGGLGAIFFFLPNVGVRRNPIFTIFLVLLFY